MDRQRGASEWSRIHAVFLVWLVVLAVLAGVGSFHGSVAQSGRGEAAAELSGTRTTRASTATKPIPLLPGGRTRIFDHQFLVAYYGTAGTGALGVLGQAPPDQIWNRLVRAGRPFVEPGERLQPVFELIVSVATRGPGPDGDYSNDISRASVQQYIDAAHRHGCLLVLDVQPGRSDFLRIVKRWAWALRDPWVGLALDPEWRMGPHQVPAQVVGSVGAAEVNRVSAWLEQLTVADRLPQKLFVIHQFRRSMLPDVARIVPRPHLALVQHVDGFGTPGEKLATFHSVARPRQFTLGFKLFYRADTRLMSPARVRAIRPRVSFVSYQ